MERNDDMQIEKIGDNLEGKNIALLVTGGIAAYKCPSLIRHFRQYGANVIVYQTNESKHYVAERALEWASMNPVVSELSAATEHLNEGIDAYVVAPLTYNTLAKFSSGISDNAVTATFASALGRLEAGKTSILIAPAMHSSMQNSIYKENLERLKAKGIRVIEPDCRIGKANLPGIHYIVVEVIREISKSALKGKNILVTAGPIGGKIDSVRLMTNIFRGRLGVMIADEAYMRGANVRLLMGQGGTEAPAYINTAIAEDFDGYYSKVMGMLSEKHYDFGIFSAAVADYVPEEAIKGKIPSRGALKSIPVKQTLKVIKEVRKNFAGLFMATFKFEIGVSKERLEEIAKARVAEGYNLVVANRDEDMRESHNAIIADSTGIIAEPSSKKEIAVSLLNILERRIAE